MVESDEPKLHYRANILSTGCGWACFSMRGGILLRYKGSWTGLAIQWSMFEAHGPSKTSWCEIWMLGENQEAFYSMLGWHMEF